MNVLVNPLDDLATAKSDRLAGHRGRSFDDVITDMELIVAEARK